MKMILSVLSIMGLSVMLFSSRCEADLYVQSVRAPILSEPSLGSAKVAEAVKGEAVKELEKSGNWYKVGYRDKTGWISRLLVNSNPPAGKVSVLEESAEKLDKTVRKRASAFTTAAAARGLAEDRARISDKFKVDYKSVEIMEALNIREEEAVRFIRYGVEK